ncbi:MAG: DNA ligase, partial [Cyclobacteriaceae bacterium]
QHDLTKLALTDRKKVLRNAFSFKDPLRLLPYTFEDAEKLLNEACQKGWEGLIAKEASGKYVHSRSKKWLKFKCGKGQEFVIGGYSEPQGERVGFGALLIGYYENDQLKYAGKVGTGFNDVFLEEFHNKLSENKRESCPFSDFDENERNMTWVTPIFVGEVGFTEWTSSGKLRHPRFLGLRNDESAKDVVKE